MKLLFALDSLGSGGAQRQMVSLAVGLKNRGHHVEFFIYYPHLSFFRSALDQANVPVHCLPKKSRLALDVPLALWAQIRRGAYEGILAFLETPTLYAELGKLVSPRVPLIVSERSAFQSNTLTLEQKIKGHFHRLANLVTVNSRHQCELMRQKHPWLSKKLITVYNGVDSDRFAACDFPSNLPIRLLAIASVVPNKNFLGLIEALHLFKESWGTPPLISWAGKTIPNRENDAALAQAKDLLSRYGLEQNWQWLGERSDIPALIAAHHAVIHPSFFEGFPNAICEALISGRPVLASRVCDHPYLIQEGETGFLFDPSAPKEIATAIHRFVCLSTAQHLAMGRKAREVALRELSMDRMVQKYEELFSNLIPAK